MGGGVIPFPLTIASHSAFIDQLAQEEGDFAVVDFPTSRKWGKCYMFYQVRHGRKIVGGTISRTPDDVYAFMDASPLLGPMRAGAALDPDLDFEEQFDALDAQGIRYLIVHKRFLKQEDWQVQLVDFPPPFYEDEWLIAYRTTPAMESESP